MVFRDNSAEPVAAQTIAVTGSPVTGYRGTCRPGLAI